MYCTLLYYFYIPLYYAVMSEGGQFYVVCPQSKGTLNLVLCPYIVGSKVNVSRFDRKKKHEVEEVIVDPEEEIKVCRWKVYNLTENLSHYIVNYDLRISVMVYLMEEDLSSVYMVVPLEHWSLYYLVFTPGKGSFILIVSEKATRIYLSLFEDSSSKSRKYSLKSNSVFKLNDCDNHDGEISYAGTKVVAERPVGVLSGHCPVKYTTLNTQMLLPTLKYRVYDFYAFCMFKRVDCDTYVIAQEGADFIYIEYNYAKTESKHEPISVGKTQRKKLSTNIRIQSASPIQVYVIFHNAHSGMGSDVWCLVIPTDLFSSVYLLLLPLAIDLLKNYILIISTQALTDLFLDNTAMSSLTSPVEILYADQCYIYHIPLLASNISNRIQSKRGRPFGCYIYGLGVSNAFLTPVGFLEGQPVLEDDSTTPQEESKKTSQAIVTKCIQSLKIKDDMIDNDCDGKIDEELDNKVDDDNDGEVDEDTSSNKERACPKGMFGHHCDKVCRCQQLQCQVDGRCLPNVQCIEGYFGTACQYRDLLQTALVNQESVKDKSRTKCVSSNEIESPLVIQFPNTIRFTWLQIKASSKETNGYKLTFKGVESNKQFILDCSNERHIHVDTATLLIFCHVTKYISEISLSWKGRKELCAAHVSGGRNLAFQQSTILSSHYKGGNKKPAPQTVDGKTEEDSSGCARTREDDKQPTWTLDFRVPVILDEIVIYFHSIPEDSSFDVKLLDRKGNELYHRYEKIKPRVSLIPDTDSNIYIIIISGNTSFSICEVEAYGECGPPVYGTDCSDICSNSCEEQKCTLDGYCRHCHNATGGKHCYEGCISWCEEDVKEDVNVTLGSQTTTAPANRRSSGFHIENFWYYCMVAWAIICIMCVSVVDAPAETDTEKDTLEDCAQESRQSNIQQSRSQESYYSSNEAMAYLYNEKKPKDAISPGSEIE